jgi:hypothetical protein
LGSIIPDPFYVVSANFLISSSIVLVDFSVDLQVDSILIDPTSYTVTGPSSVTILGVSTANSRTIALSVSGVVPGTYLVTVVGVIHSIDLELLLVGGNNASFVALSPYSARSIFTHKGPIVKPERVVQSGNQWSVQTTTMPFFGITTTNEVVLTGASLDASHIGLYLRLEQATGVADLVNGGLYKIISVTNPTRVRVESSFRPPASDPSNNLVTNVWTIYDPNVGFIANNPSDVIVRVNGTPVSVDLVIGLLGQIVLTSPPAPGSSISIDYSWISNPTVEIRRLNSKEFRSNQWDRTTWSSFPYRNVLQRSEGATRRLNKAFGIGTTLTNTITDSSVNFLTSQVVIGDTLVITSGVNIGNYQVLLVGAHSVTISTIFPQVTSIQAPYSIPGRDDIRAPQPQPVLRELFYRAYERAYTAVSNDPTLLVLNSPKNRIAYKPLSRQISEVSVAYDADTLPEVDPIHPWQQVGIGTASVAGGFLSVTHSTIGPYPEGQPFFWTQGVDLTFPHAYATTWRLRLDSTIPDGVFTGVCTGWSDSSRVAVLGYLLDGGVRKIGFLTRGNGNNPSLITGWSGGLDGLGNPTGVPIVFDWSTLHSYRLFRDTSGVVRFYVDGEVIASLAISEAQLPFLEELDDSFNEIQNIFFGALSRKATSQSSWDFVHYLVLPTNPQQSVPSAFASYTPVLLPENSSPPWTPVGYHGNESLLGGLFVLDSTSATDLATSSEVGLVGGDFKGFNRIEPLLSVSSNTVLDFGVTLRTLTHGIAPNSVMVAVDDGNRLVQVCFFPTRSQPKVSYPGRSLPQDATPRPWMSFGGSPVSMVGRILRIEDTSLVDGRVFAIEDLEPIGSDNRILSSFKVQNTTTSVSMVVSTFTDLAANFDIVLVQAGDNLIITSGVNAGTYQIESATTTTITISGTFPVNLSATTNYEVPSNDYIYEFKCEVLSSTPDLTADHFCGATVDAYDGLKTVGVMLRKDPSPQVAFHSDGIVVQSFVFNWDDQRTHVYRVVKNGVANLVILYIDGVLIGSYAYSGFTTVATATPTLSFGSSTTSSNQSLSVVDWHYVNGWRAQTITGVRHYVGIWKGSDANSLLGYYLPLSAKGQARTSGNQLTDLLADFVASGVQIGDDLIIDVGENRGVYSIASVNPTTLTTSIQFPQPGPTVLDYRIPSQLEWAIDHTYQLLRDPSGFIGLFIDSSTTPIIQVEYNHTTLPSSSVGIPYQFNRGLPSVTWGAFDPTNLSQSAWKFLQYGITRAPIEVKEVPSHQVSNQRNIMSSPEHLFGQVPHNHTQYSSASTGVPYLWESYANNPNSHAFTQLNEGTPLVPSTQTFEVRKKSIPPFAPYSASGFGGSALGTDGFGYGTVGAVPSLRVSFQVPPGVLYNRLEVIEHASGKYNLLTAFSDDVVSMVFNPPVVSLSISLSGDSGILADLGS